MMRGRALMLATSVALAVACLVGAGAASAVNDGEGPEFGRCVKVGKGNGNSFGHSCLYTSGKSAYEWVGLTPESPGRGFTMKSGGATLETTSAASIKCKATSGTGEFLGGRWETVALSFAGCSLGKGTTCQSEASPPGTIQTVPLTATFAREPGLSLIGFHAEPSSGTTVAAFGCGTQAATLSGSFDAQLPQGEKMSTKFGWKLTQKGGEPGLTKLEGLPDGALSLSLGEGSPHPAGLAAKLTQTNEEATEANNEL